MSVADAPQHRATVRDLLLARADDQRTGLLFEDRRWTWEQVVAASAARAAVLRDLLPDDSPPHVGVLLDNLPEFCFLLGAAALDGVVVVGLNATRRGSALADDIARTDVQVVLTEDRHASLLPRDLSVPVIDVDGATWRDRLDQHRGSPVSDRTVAPDELMMLIFTSGTSGTPKAVRVTQHKIAGPGRILADRFDLGADDVAYVSMPMFHSNAVMAGWAPALAGGAAVALARRFSASGFLPDVRRFGATYANYVGKPLTHVMATPPRPDDAENPLRMVFGNEANDRDIAGFAERFDCTVVDSYSSTENAVIVQRRPDMPPGSLGRPVEGVEVRDPATGAVTADAEFDDEGRLRNPDAAIGELVNAHGAGAFAGYYGDPEAEAERMRDGMYWSGDLAYRDAAGWIYFAGRSSEWLRVDGENLAVAPIERILLRHPAVLEAAVYAVPDPDVGDQVAAALRTDGTLGPSDFEDFLTAQEDLGPKAWPRHVRLLGELPRTATDKVLKRELASSGPLTGEVRWEREPRGTAYAVR